MIMFNLNKLVMPVLFLIALMVSGCSNQSPKSIDTAETQSSGAARDVPSSAMIRHKPYAWLKEKKKQQFTEQDLIWDRLLALYALQEVDDPRVERELNWFLDHPDYIARVQERAEPYLYQIINEIEAQQLPGELALLPVVESAFKPDAVSNASAAGLWQFMPGTGKDFGLTQNWWYDGRHDIYTSTQAAAAYLKDLSEAFNGDWLLALASYNYGKTNIQRAIDRNIMRGDPADYWSLQSLPAETMQYVPKLLAVAKLFAHAKEYGIPLKPIKNKPVFEMVDVGSPLYLTQAAAMANTSPTEFLTLNPAFKQNATAPDGPHHLLIPVEEVDAFKQKLELMPMAEKEQLASELRNQYWEMMEAKRAEELERQARRAEAERLARIAQEERLAQYKAAQELKRAQAKAAQEERMAQLRAAQAEKKAQALLLARQKAAELVLAKKLKKPNDGQPDGHYAVKQMDAAMKLAHNSTVSAKEVAKLNNASQQIDLKVAQKDKVAAKGKLQLVASNFNRNPFQTIHYVIKKGESLTGIARKFNVSVGDIRKWNASVGNIQAGQRLKVIVDAAQPVT